VYPVVRRWQSDQSGRLAVFDIPDGLVGQLGGRSFTGSMMLVAGDGLCVGVSKATPRYAPPHRPALRTRPPTCGSDNPSTYPEGRPGDTPRHDRQNCGVCADGR
jgi:hypothetical protein